MTYWDHILQAFPFLLQFLFLPLLSCEMALSSQLSAPAPYLDLLLRTAFSSSNRRSEKVSVLSSFQTALCWAIRRWNEERTSEIPPLTFVLDAAETESGVGSRTLNSGVGDKDLCILESGLFYPSEGFKWIFRKKVCFWPPTENCPICERLCEIRIIRPFIWLIRDCHFSEFYREITHYNLFIFVV